MSVNSTPASRAVASFYEALGETPEETLSAYLISMLEDSPPNTLDLLELQEIVAGFCPSFDATPHAKKHALLSQLVKQVRQGQSRARVYVTQQRCSYKPASTCYPGYDPRKFYTTTKTSSSIQHVSACTCSAK